MISPLLEFLDASPVNFLAVYNIASKLIQAGYRHLDPAMPIGNVTPGDKFFVTKKVNYVL